MTLEAPTPGAATSAPLLEARHVVVRFGGLTAVDDVSLAVRPDELLAVVGPNGAGKTTLFNVLAGAQRPTAGSVHLDGDDVTRLGSHLRARRGLSRTFQVVRPFLGETALRNVAIAAVGVGAKRADALERAEALLVRVGLATKVHTVAGELGAGERKRLELARALAVQPRVLLLDEVMAGLNPVEVSGITELLRVVMTETGVHIVLIEHLLKAVHALADRVIVLESGTVLAEGTPAEVFTNDEVIKAYLGAKYAAS